MRNIRKHAANLAKAFRLHGEALSLYNQGWAVMGAIWGGGHWMIEPDGRKHVSHTPRSGFLDAATLMLATSRAVVTVNLGGQVCGKCATEAEKKSQILRDADRWHESAFKGWADTPGACRDERLAVEAALRQLAA